VTALTVATLIPWLLVVVSANGTGEAPTPPSDPTITVSQSATTESVTTAAADDPLAGIGEVELVA
jgi:hypothetical protein